MKTLRILLLAGFALTAAAISHAQVAGPVHQLKRVDDKLVLAGATRDAPLSSPRFEYAN